MLGAHQSRAAEVAGAGIVCIALGAAAALKPELALAGAVALLVAVLAWSRPRDLVVYWLPAALLVPMSFLVHRGAGPDLSAIDATLVVATLAALTTAALEPTPLPRLPRSVKWAFGIYGGYVCALALAVPSAAAVNEAFTITLVPAVGALLVFWAVRTRADLERLARMLVLVASIAALLGLFESARRQHLIPETPGVIFYSTDRSGFLRAQSVFPHPIVFGLLLAMVIPITIACWMRSRHVVFLAALAIQSAALLLTFSRGPWLGAVAGILAMAALGGRRGAKPLLALLAALVALGASPLGGPVTDAARSLVSPETSADVSTVSYRRQLFDAAWSYMREHPLGGSLAPSDRPVLFRLVNGQVLDVGISVDNAYLKYGLAVGIVGLVTVLWLLLVLLREALRNALASPGDPLPAALLGSLVAIVLVSATVATFSWAQAGLAFSLIVGMTLAYGHLRAPSTGPTSQSRPPAPVPG